MGKVVRGTLLLVVLVIFISGVVAVYTVFFNPADDVTMPLLIGKSLIEAAEDAKRMGIHLKVEQATSSLPPGQVLAQSPEANARIRKNETAVLQVSKGASRRSIPDVRGLPVAQAQSSIQEQGFNVGDVIYIKDDSRPVGTVIAQSPAAPASVPGDKKIDLLVNQMSSGADGKVVVPDVAQMTERQARELLTASGLKVMAVDSVYTPNATEGAVVGTRPAAGTSSKVGDGIRLRVATTKRPEGVPEPPKPKEADSVKPQTSPTPQVVVPVQGHDDVVVVDNDARPVDTNISVFDQRSNPSSSRPSAPSAPATQPAPPAVTPTPAPSAPQPLPVGGKIARIRYQVPPLARPLQLKIELTDPTGTKVLLDRPGKGGEYISLDAPYSKECTVAIYLGGEFIWQDKYM